MKKVFLGLAIAMATGVSAQVDFSSTRFGLTAGVNYSRVRNAHNPSGPIWGFQAGGLALIPIDSDDQFYIQPEVLYYTAGETGKDKDMKGKNGYNAKYANNYISVPLYFKGYFSEAESEFFGMVGPRFNFLMSQKVTNPARDYYDPNIVNPQYPNINGKANKFNFGVGLGLGYSYKRQLEVNVKYDIGISNTYPNMVEGWTGDPNTQKRKSEQVLSVGLSYIFE